MKEVYIKNFSKWTIAEVVKEFNLRQDFKNQKLASWMTVDKQPTDFEQHLLNHLQNRLEERIYAWNEQELAINFIGPVLSLVDFNGNQYHSFSKRELSVLHKEERLYGLVDVVVADGLFIPERPYFFIKEFKKEVDSSNDPLGQLLIAMIVAQMLNENENPIYGAYVRGRNWHFVLLEGAKNTKSIIDTLAEQHS